MPERQALPIFPALPTDETLTDAVFMALKHRAKQRYGINLRRANGVSKSRPTNPPATTSTRQPAYCVTVFDATLTEVLDKLLIKSQQLRGKSRIFWPLAFVMFRQPIYLSPLPIPLPHKNTTFYTLQPLQLGQKI